MLVECHECKGRVSTEAGSCPHCGAPVSAPETASGTLGQAPERRGGSTLQTRTRRYIPFVLLAAAAWLAWAMLPPSSREGIQQIARNVARAEQPLYDETFDVPAGAWQSFGFTLRHEGKVTARLAVEDGPAVDIFLMNGSQYKDFEEVAKSARGGQFGYLTSLSSSSVRSLERSTILPVGEYSMVVRSTAHPPLIGKGPVTRTRLTIRVQR